MHTAPATTRTIPAPGTIADPVTSPTVTTDRSEPVDSSDDVDRGTSSARCADGHGTLSHLFFSEDDHEIARAKSICGPCGRRDACLQGAIDRQEPYGVWGGKLVLDGIPVEFKRKRGRPPKQPRPILVVEEVPVPPHLVA